MPEMKEKVHYMTQETHDLLPDLISRMEGKISQEIKKEMDPSDAVLNAKIRTIEGLKDTLSNAKIIDNQEIKTKEVSLGTAVKIKYIDNDKEEVIAILGCCDSLYLDKDGIIIYSIHAPITQQLLNKRVSFNQVYSLETPEATMSIQILWIKNFFDYLKEKEQQPQ